MDSAEVPAKPARPPSPPEHPPGGGRGLTAGQWALAACGLVVAAGLVAVILTADGDPPGSGPLGPARTASGFRAADPGTVVVDGVSGTVRVTADPGAREVTGSFHRADGSPATLHAVTTEGAAPAGHALSLRCADGRGDPRPCAGDLVLTLPEHTGLRLRQTSGTALIEGIGGDVSLDASSIRLTTRDLRSPHAKVTVVSGSADIGFAAAPADLDLHASSASVDVTLPRTGDGYAVTTTSASADVQVTVPRDLSADHRVALTVASGSLSVSDA